jgi:hypothetical protein
MANIGKKAKQVTTIIKPKIIEHEHDFVKETNRDRIHCVTCGAYYCQLCGIELEDEVTNHNVTI